MTQPTLASLALVDPVLTGMLVGYAQADDRFVASKVFPQVPSANKSGTYPIFTKKYWFTDEMVTRAPGSKYARSGYGVSSTTYDTLQWGLEHPIPDENREENQTGMPLEMAGVNWLAQKSLIRKERAWAADFMKTGVWGTDDSNSATDWDDYAAGDPISDVLTATRTISNNTGSAANTMVLGYIVHNALVNHPDIIDRVKYTSPALQAQIMGILAAAFGVQNYWVSKASYNSANEGQTFAGAAIIDDDCLVCHVTPIPGKFVPSAGYTFSWNGGGGMGEIRTYRDDSVDSDILKSKEQWDQKAVATDVGYFFSDIV